LLTGLRWEGCCGNFRLRNPIHCGIGDDKLLLPGCLEAEKGDFRNSVEKTRAHCVHCDASTVRQENHKNAHQTLLNFPAMLMLIFELCLCMTKLMSPQMLAEYWRM
jgi:hypothetical protein